MLFSKEGKEVCLFSIIVPIYKTEIFLPQCIDSILNQSFKDFELILVNDGSPDDSGSICDEYQKKDKRISVIHKENGGVSDARNRGILAATGKYIWFIDSDDYMVESALANISNIINKYKYVDIITCPHIDKYINKNDELILITDKQIIAEKKEYTKILFSKNSSYWAPWKNIFNNMIIKENKLLFSTNLNCSEDCDFFMKFFEYAKKFIIHNKPGIYYRIDREGSITNSMKKKDIIDQLITYSSYYYKFNTLDKNYDKQIKRFFANKFANVITLIHILSKEEDINEAVNFIKIHKKILRDTNGIKYTVARFVWSLLGIHNGSTFIFKVRSKILDKE